MKKSINFINLKAIIAIFLVLIVFNFVNWNLHKQNIQTGDYEDEYYLSEQEYKSKYKNFDDLSGEGSFVSMTEKGTITYKRNIIPYTHKTLSKKPKQYLAVRIMCKKSCL